MYTQKQRILAEVEGFLNEGLSETEILYQLDINKKKLRNDLKVLRESGEKNYRIYEKIQQKRGLKAQEG